MVGDVAWAVNGMAAPDLINLLVMVSKCVTIGKGHILLGKFKARVLRVHKVTERNSASAEFLGQSAREAHLLSASTTIKMILLKGALCTSPSLKLAFPAIKGL